MALRINFNYEAATTHTAILQNERQMNKSLLRLSTGLRILNAADDSAGLFIANQLMVVASGLEEGNRNIQTGLSALRIAENAAGQIFDKLNEVYRRAIRAANDINDPNARNALQQEVRNFIDAVQKIGTDTEYNGIKLLDGSFRDKYIHYGARDNQVVYLSIRDLRAQSLGAHMVATRGQTEYAGDTINNVQNVVSDQARYINIAGRSVLATAEYDGFHLYDAGVVAENINSQLSDVGFSAKAVNVSRAKEYTAIASGTQMGDTVDLIFYVGGKTVELRGLNPNVSLNELVSRINSAAATAGADLTASVDNGRLVLTSSKGYTIGVQVNVNTQARVTVNLDQLIEGAQAQRGTTASAVKVGQLYIASQNSFTHNISDTAFGDFRAGMHGYSEFKNLYSVDVTSNENAELSTMIVTTALRTVDSIRAQIGAVMNNLQSIYDSQKVALDNTREAENVIRNTDYAEEMSNFVKLQIRMQASMAMLAQANQLPQLVLQLLR